MERLKSMILVGILLAGTTLGQAVQPPPANEPDPHENPIIQNSPEGKKTSPGDVVRPTPQPKVKKGNETTKDAPSKPAAPPPPALQSEEAILGTWDLVLEKSRFNPGPAPKSEVRIYVKTPDGIQATVTTTDINGKIRSMNYLWYADGRDRPVTGSNLLDTIRLERVDNLTSEGTLKHGDKVIASERRQFTADGQTLEIVMKDLSSTDRPNTATLVYKRRRFRSAGPATDARPDLAERD